jgi:glycosyltransferase involved in cell wall biosynthesis
MLREALPDLLHANSLSTARIAGPVAVEAGVRSIGHLRDIVKLTSQAMDDLNQHTRLVAVSRATRDFHVSQGLDAAKCVVLNNGVDLARCRSQKLLGYLHRQLGLPMGTQLIAVIGQLGLRKGTDVALAAALRVAEHLPHVHWLIVGERTSNKPESRNFEAKLHEIALQKPLAGRVHFLGSRTDVEQWLNECTLLVHAARQEPLGRVLLEAAAAGVAVVATDVGGTREIFPTEQDGALLVRPDDPMRLAETILSVLNDDDRRQTLAAAARRRAESTFDIRIAAARLVEQYQRVLG